MENKPITYVFLRIVAVRVIFFYYDGLYIILQTRTKTNVFVTRDDQGYPPYEMGGYGGAPMQPPPSWGPSPDMRGPPQGDFNPGQGGGR